MASFGVKVIRLVVGMLSTNCYIVADPGEGGAYVIDPGGETRKVVAAVKREKVKPLGVLCTHGHMDHVGAAGKVSQEFGVPVFISREDSAVFRGAPHGFSVGSLFISKPKELEFLAHGDEFSLGGGYLKVLATPGHTPGSLSFLAEGALFCGDLVFEGSVGRTDLKGGSFSELIDSIRRYVAPLSPETKIFPGHGPQTTVGMELAHNPFLEDLRRRA